MNSVCSNGQPGIKQPPTGNRSGHGQGVSQIPTVSTSQPAKKLDALGRSVREKRRTGDSDVRNFCKTTSRILQ